MSFWVRSLATVPVVIDDLGQTVAPGIELDLQRTFPIEDIVNSADLQSAVMAGELTCLDGPGGAQIEWNDCSGGGVPPHGMHHHNLSQLSGLNSVLEGVTLDDDSAARPPLPHSLDSHTGTLPISLLSGLEMVVRYNSRHQHFAGAVSVLFDAVPICDADVFATPSKDVTEVLVSGRYLVHIDVTADMLFSNSRTTSACWLERRLASQTGWSKVDGTHAGLYHRRFRYGINTASITWPMELGAGDALRVRAQRLSGRAALYLVGGACRFSVVRMG